MSAACSDPPVGRCQGRSAPGHAGGTAPAAPHGRVAWQRRKDQRCRSSWRRSGCAAPVYHGRCGQPGQPRRRSRRHALHHRRDTRMTPAAVNRYGSPVTFDRPWRVISVTTTSGSSVARTRAWTPSKANSPRECPSPAKRARIASRPVALAAARAGQTDRPARRRRRTGRRTPLPRRPWGSSACTRARSRPP